MLTLHYLWLNRLNLENIIDVAIAMNVILLIEAVNYLIVVNILPVKPHFTKSD